MFAIISINGNQHKVFPDKQYKVELKEPENFKDGKIVFDQVLLISDEKTVVGTPIIKGASVEAEIVEPAVKDDKVLVFKFHAKKRYKRTRGHRQVVSLIKIVKINPNEK